MRECPVSFEFYPPRDEAQSLLLQTSWRRLARLGPRCLSVTFGAGGSAQEATLGAVESLLAHSRVPVAPHVSCMVRDRERLHALLSHYLDCGVSRLVVLRGDRPRADGFERPFEHASDLVSWVHARFPGRFFIEVGCYPEKHPESQSMDEEIRHFRTKVAAGAGGAITQYFFEAGTYFEFVDRCRTAGIDIPIVPGIMPITNYIQLASFSARCGARIPSGLATRLASFGDDLASLRDYGADAVASLCEQLLSGGAPGLHFYTLNRARATTRLIRRIRGGVFQAPKSVSL